jgi:hypothetical protein
MRFFVFVEHATEDAMAKLVGIIVGCAVLALLLIYLQLQLVVLTSSLTFSVGNATTVFSLHSN